MDESGMWKSIKPALKEFSLDPYRIENSVGAGCPDVNYLKGWLELKYVKRWPKRGGALRLPHFTPLQREWLRRRWEHGGKAFLLLRVDKEWLLFGGKIAASHVGNFGREALIALSILHTTKKMEVAKWLAEN